MTPHAHAVFARSWRSGRVVPLMLLLSFAIAVGMGLYALVSLRAVLVREMGANLAGTAGQVADTLDRVLFERFGDIQVFANDRILIEGDREQKLQRLQGYMKLYWYYSWLGITDATGHIIVGSSEFPDQNKTGGEKAPPAAGGGSDSDPADWFTAVRQTGRVYLEGARRSPELEGRMAVGVSAPIYGPQGDFRGVVTSRVSLEKLRAIFQQEGKLGHDEEGYDWLLLDRQGTILIEKSRTPEVNGRPLMEEMPNARRAIEGRDESGFVEELHQRQLTPVVSGYAKTRGYNEFPGFGWTVLVRLDRDRAYAPINRLIWTVGSIGLLLVVPLAGFGMWASWKVVLEHRDLVRTQQSLEESIAELARSNADLQQFAYVASHDLQEPLRMVASYTQLIAKRYKGKLDADADEFIGYAVEGATRMQRLINDLLAYSRVTTQGRVFDRVDCNQILDEVLSNLRVAVEESQAVVTHDALPVVTADGGQLGQLFQNLIGNAIKFRGDVPPRIHVSAERRNREWRFSVCDNGIGVDPQFAERIFIIFQRLHNRDEYPGTGIGLALCKKIVERHGGHIWVESPIGHGSVFYFTLPIGVHDHDDS